MYSREAAMSESPPADGAHAETEPSGATVLVVSDDRELAGAVTGAVSPEGHSVLRAASLEEAARLAGERDAGVAIVDLDMSPAPGRREVESLRRAGEGLGIVCVSSGPDGERARGATPDGAKCLGRPPEAARLLAEIDRLVAISAHRRGLEECERREKECAVTRPVAPRSRRRFRRLVVLAALGVVLAAAVAVPLIVRFYRSASRAAKEGTEAVGGALESLERIEGHLKRDEQRELAPRGR
jgi:CheY-like chemotaxis protein